MRPQSVREDARFFPAAEHELRQACGVPPDRGLGVGRTFVQRPLRIALRPCPVPGEDACLHGPDRPAPAARGRVLVTLAVAVGGPREPPGGALCVAGHQLRQPGAVGGVSHSGQLPLPHVRVVGEALLSVQVP